MQALVAQYSVCPSINWAREIYAKHRPGKPLTGINTYIGSGLMQPQPQMMETAQHGGVCGFVCNSVGMLYGAVAL